jgi:hypothetical protein
MMTSSTASGSGSRASMSVSACLESGVLVTSPSEVNADDSNAPVRSIPRTTSAPQSASTRRGRAVADSARRRGLREKRLPALSGTRALGWRIAATSFASVRSLMTDA